MTARLLFGFDDGVAQWIADLVPQCGRIKGAKTIGLIRDGKLVAACGFTEWRKELGDIEVHFASTGPGWQRRDFLRACFKYPFIQLGCNRVTATVMQGNKKVFRALNALNFKYEGCKRELFEGRGAVILGLLRREVPAWALPED